MKISMVTSFHFLVIYTIYIYIYLSSFDLEGGTLYLLWPLCV